MTGKGPRTRIAPTPSGFLHAGNAWSFLIAWLCARSRGGTVHLRIDDLDTARLRPEYLDDIFASLGWLGLDWDTGPRDAADFRSRHSQTLRLAEYRSALERLAARGGEGPAVFPCACSREKARQDSAAAGTPGLYAGTCRAAGIAWERAAFPGEAARPGEARGGELHLRARVPIEAAVRFRDARGGTAMAAPGRDMGDFVVWQKNGLPAYQLASVVDDESLGVDFVVRGMDLLASTGAQIWLAEAIGAAGFRGAEFLHHPLLLAPEGGKLSKSAGAESLLALRARGDSRDLIRYFAARLGIDPAGVSGAADLVPAFRPEAVPAADLEWAPFASALRLA